MSSRSTRSVRSESSRRMTSARLEEQLVKKRQAEEDRLNFWDTNSTYFRAWDFNTAQYSNWTSNAFYSSSLENQKKTLEAKKKQEKLEQRRKKLSQLLANEDEKLQKELKEGRRRKVEMPLEDMKLANMEILLREEEKRRKERDVKLYHYWRQNQPTIRDFERKQQNDFVKRSWLQQVLEKKKEREEEEKKMLEHMEELKLLEEKHVTMENEIREQRKKTEQELKTFLEKQIKLIKCKEEQEKILKAEEAEALREQKEIEVILEERTRIEERRKRSDLNLFHKRQYQLMLRRRAQQVQEDLQADRKLLDKVAEEENRKAQEESSRNEKFKKELELAREAFKKQAEVEKLRGRQADFLFDEEAKKMYEKQEIQWKVESETRNNLMRDVLKMIEVQIKEKLLENLKNQAELRKTREEMTKAMAMANNELKDYQEKTKQTLADWRKDLDQQVLERQLQAVFEKKKQEEDKENELRAKREEEEKLFKELSQMNLLGHQPRMMGRRKFAPL